MVRYAGDVSLRQRLDSLTVTTVATSGATLRVDVDLTEGDEPGTYTFTMPAAPVTVNATFKESTVTGKPGDVNGDGDVNVMDITALIDIIMNDGTNPRADVNEDGDINVMDITALIDIIMNS